MKTRYTLAPVGLYLLSHYRKENAINVIFSKSRNCKNKSGAEAISPQRHTSGSLVCWLIYLPWLNAGEAPSLESLRVAAERISEGYDPPWMMLSSHLVLQNQNKEDKYPQSPPLIPFISTLWTQCDYPPHVPTARTDYSLNQEAESSPGNLSCSGPAFCHSRWEKYSEWLAFCMSCKTSLRWLETSLRLQTVCVLEWVCLTRDRSLSINLLRKT